MTGNRGAGRAGKPRKEREGENRPERTPQNKAVADKKGGERSEPQTALRDSGGSAPPVSRARRGRAEWETNRSALVGAKESDQPRTGAKRGRRTRWGARSTATGGAYEQIKSGYAIQTSPVMATKASGSEDKTRRTMGGWSL